MVELWFLFTAVIGLFAFMVEDVLEPPIGKPVSLFSIIAPPFSCFNNLIFSSLCMFLIYSTLGVFMNLYIGLAFIGVLKLDPVPLLSEGAKL